jgi:hypothetical protein
MLPEKLRCLRLEVAVLLPDGAPVWTLIDWIRDQADVPSEMVRVVQRFNRIVLKLQARKGGRGPASKYADLLGVRLRVNLETAGVFIVGPHAAKLVSAPVVKTGAETQWLAVLGERSRAAQASPTPAGAGQVRGGVADGQEQAESASGDTGRPPP